MSVVTGCCGHRFVRDDLEECPWDEDCSHCCEFLRCESCNHSECPHKGEWEEHVKKMEEYRRKIQERT